MIFDRVIKNARIVTGSDTTVGSIYIKDGKIAAITDTECDFCANEVTDANGKYVLPGFIDTHVHSRDGVNGAHYKEDFFHSTSAAAVSGFTTIYEMPNCNPTIYNVEMLNSLIECVTPKAHTDFGVWGLALGDLNANEIDALARAGVVGFKFFWGYAVNSKTYQLVYNYREGMEDVTPPPSLAEIYRIFENVQGTGKRLAIHAEDFDVIKILTERALKKDDRSYSALLATRPEESELSTISKAISYAKLTGLKLHILHLAVGRGVELIKRAQDEGICVTCETCPQYLALSDEDGGRLGAKMKWYPLVRTKKDSELLWKGLAAGTLSHVASDHAPHSIAEKELDVFDAPSGMGGVETMSLILLNAVHEGKLTINDVARLLSENPARLFGTYPRKGNMSVGADADLVIVDPNMEHTIDQNKLHSKIKLSPFNGMHIVGMPTETILRGVTTAKDGEIVSPPTGRFVAANN